mgnify:CR=1 FL=1
MNRYTEHYHNMKALERPKGTTHAKIVTSGKKKARVAIKDFDTFEGVEGEVTFLKEKRGGKYEELGKMYFDGVWPIKQEEE